MLDAHLAHCARPRPRWRSRTASASNEPHGIRVNSVNPTIALTPMAVQAWPEPVKRDAAPKGIPLGRPCDGGRGGRARALLLSDAASMISSVALPVDGGHTYV